jgi:hypothetical protein
VGFADRVSPEYVHEGLLLLIALTAAAACVVGAALLVRHAPAVSIGLIGALGAGVVAFFVAAADGRHGVLAVVASTASAGLVVGGTIGAVVTRGQPPSSTLWRSAVACAVLALFGAALTFFALQQACPLYVTRGAGFCFYDFDMLGAWASGVTFLFIVDVLVVVALLLISGLQAKRREGIRLGDDEWARL